MVTRLVARVHEQLGVVLPLRAVFASETLAALATTVTTEQSAQLSEPQLTEIGDWLQQLELS